MLVAAGCLEDDQEPPEPARVLGDVLGLAARGARAAPSMTLPEPPLSARQDGSAALTVHANDRAGLERLCRYGLRPPLALERLAFTEDGRVRYRMKRTFSDGTRELVLVPTELLRRLAALVPPRRSHLVRYHGAFVPRARGRRALTGARHRIPPKEFAPPEPTLGPAAPAPIPVPADAINPAADEFAARPRRLPWAELLRRVHQIDVLRCTRCTGRLRILAFLTDPCVILAILSHLGLPTTLPRPKPARSPPQQDLDFGDSPNEIFVDPLPSD